MKTSMETTKLLALAVALLCSACQTIPAGQVLVEAGPKPTSDQAEAVIRAQLARSLRDPDSMKAFKVVSGPDEMTATNAGGNFERAWLVCAEYNAKNAYGGYTGLSSHAFPLRQHAGEWVVVSAINWRSMSKQC